MNGWTVIIGVVIIVFIVVFGWKTNVIPCPYIGCPAVGIDEVYVVVPIEGEDVVVDGVFIGREDDIAVNDGNALAEVGFAVAVEGIVADVGSCAL